MYPVSEQPARRVSSLSRQTSVPEAYNLIRGTQRPSDVDTPLTDNVVSTNQLRETRLVIGLDFGTTYTGIAFATPSGSVCSLDQITNIIHWGEDMTNLDKVPSIISYTKSPGNLFRQWGGSISPEAVTMVHKKLELRPLPLQGELDLLVRTLKDMQNLHFEDIVQGSEDGNIPAHPSKTPEEIVTDYLTKVYARFDESLRNFKIPESFRQHTITDLVVTIPTDWPYEALNSTYRAVTKAGFNKANFPRLSDILFITESEAAARYTVRYYKEQQSENFLNDNSYFVLCDAGGGTADVVSYKVVRTLPSLQLQQIGRPTGDTCGSIFINQEFKRWLRRKIGDHNYRKFDPDLNLDRGASQGSETPAMRELMSRFNDRKENFKPNSTHDIVLWLPKPLDNYDLPGVVRSGEIIITRAEMESFFDNCLERIVSMIEDHMAQIEQVAGGKAKNLFLVGGFGSSDYLKHYLAETMKEHRIKFRTPDTSWTAIVRGAVVCGIDNAQIPSLRRARACPYSYGVSMNETFHEANHRPEDMIQERDGQWYAEAQLIWLANEGDLIFLNEPRVVTKEFDISFSNTYGSIDLPIYRHSSLNDEDEGDRPGQFKNAKDEVAQVAVLTMAMSKLYAYSKLRRHRQPPHRGGDKAPKIRSVVASLAKVKYRVTLELVLELSWKSLVASIWCEGRELARVQA